MRTAWRYAAILVLASGCYTTKFETNQEIDWTTSEETRQWYMLAGGVPLSHVDPVTKCPEGRVAYVNSSFEALDIAILIGAEVAAIGALYAACEAGGSGNSTECATTYAPAVALLLPAPRTLRYACGKSPGVTPTSPKE